MTMRALDCFRAAFAVAVCLALFAIDTAFAQVNRVALVIGNSNYRHAAQLKNPANDAQDMATALRSLGFTVTAGHDLDAAGMNAKIREFAAKLEGAEIALFFYAGHGIQVDGQNYLLPTDARVPSSSTIDFELIPLDTIQRAMERGARATVIFLDACRDNPLPRDLSGGGGTRTVTLGRGLARMEAGVGSLISFSTQPGNIALDGAGRNSPYVGSLLDHLALSDKDLSEILINVRRDVMRKTGNKQIPWEHSSLTSRVYFASLPSGDPAAKALPSERETELTFWMSVRDSRDAKLVLDYLERYPKGIFVQSARRLLAQLQGRPAMSSQDSGGRALLSGSQLASAMQTELRRAGCFGGPTSGNWGPQSRAAMGRLNTLAGLSLPQAVPDMDALAAVRGLEDGFCERASASARVEPRPEARRARNEAREAPARRSAQREQRPARSSSSADAGSGGGVGSAGSFGPALKRLRQGCFIEGNRAACRQICIAFPHAKACNFTRGAAATPTRGGGGSQGFRRVFLQGRAPI